MITVVDSIMGSGKTSWAIAYMNEHPEKSFLYITPFLSEIDRVINGSKENMFQPINFGSGKLESLNNLLSSGKNIAATHELFKYIDDYSTELIVFGDYTLILDEVLEIISPLEISKRDMQLLFKSNYISVDDECYVHWNNDIDDYIGRFEEIKLLATKKQLICTNNTFMFWQYPPEIFKYFNNAFVMTYMFNASVLSKYFKVYGIEYSIKSISKVNDVYSIVDYYHPDKSLIRNLITIVGSDRQTKDIQKTTELSKTWYLSPASRAGVATLKKELYNYYRNVFKTTSDNFMWTSFISSAPLICSKGYMYKKSGINKTFVPCNARSTNQFKDKHYLAYCVNIYANPVLSRYFEARSLISGVEAFIDNDAYALSQMIQWIWRSAIRNNEPITIYIPSKRMETLLFNWMHKNEY